MQNKNHLNILIAGGSGYIGKSLTKILYENGFQVSWLTRKINSNEKTNQFEWNYQTKKIDEAAFDNIDVLINFCGASVAGKRWSKSYKKEIYESRIHSTQFLFESVNKIPNKIKSYIHGSAVGYYGCTNSDKIYSETDEPGNDFLARTCIDWELAASAFEKINMRTCIVRTAVIFSPGSQAYEKLLFPFRHGLGAAIGSGKQYFPWIHLEDYCRIIFKLITEENLKGIYNAVAPYQITNEELTRKISAFLKKKIWLPNIPSFILKIILGESANSILGGSRISSDKVIKEGFLFKYPAGPF